MELHTVPSFSPTDATSRCNSKIFIEYIVTRERAVGNLSAIEGQTADTLNSQTGL